MAKIHKGIATGSGFAYKGKDLNFSRDVYDNFKDLLYDASTYGFPDGFKTVVKDPADSSITNEKYTTFIYANSKWKVASNVKLFEHVVSDPMIAGILFNDINGIIVGEDSLKNDKIVWNTNGGVVNLTEVEDSVKTYVADNYTNTSTLNETLKSYAKLNNSANFSVLTVGSKPVATQTWTEDKINTALTQALTYKGGIANQSDITNAEATGTIKVGNVYVCTTENNYTLNGGTVRLEAGDTIICKSITGTEKWNIVQANITGAVTKSSNLASGQLVVGTGLSSVKALDAGNNGQFLTLSEGKPAWGDLPLFNGKRNGLVQTPAEDVRTGSFLSMDGTWKIPHDTTYNDATTSTRGLMTAADKVKLNGIEAGANKYVLHVATDNSLGGIKIGYTENAGEKKYKVQVSSDGKAFVYVPWTDTNTTYNDMTGATASSAGTRGLVPAPTAGQQGLFLCGNGTWAKPTDTVYSDGTGISIDNNVIKNTGVISVSKGATDDVILVTNGVNEPKPITINNVGNANVAEHAKGAGTATTAEKLTTVEAGNTNTPVYFEGGVPKSIGFTIAKSVPSNAVFTDTTYAVEQNASNSFTFNSSGSYTKTVTINNVAHATSADSATNATHATSADSATNATTATKVSNVLEIENYNPTGELLVVDTYNGSSKKTINCITVEEINGLFHS